MFTLVFVVSSIWQEVGWGSILYLAALSDIDFQLYEASKIDGANRWKQTLNITIPGILPTIMTLFILRMGHVMYVGYEKVLLLYNPVIYSTADVIATFTFRRGILDAQYSYSAAVGLFNTTINLFMLIVTNRLSKKINGNSLW